MIYPNLKGTANLIALDFETRDDNLLSRGSGAFKNDGYIIGIAVAVPEQSWYFPLDTSESEQTIKWYTEHIASNEAMTKVGANFLYDMEWSYFDIGHRILGRKYCVQSIEALLDENQFTYSLDDIAKRRGMQQKIDIGDALLANGLAKEVKKKGTVTYIPDKGQMWKLPYEVMEPYARRDAELTLELFHAQMKEVDEQGLSTVTELESDLLDVVLDMRIRGVAVDVDRAHRMVEEYKLKEKELDKVIANVTGIAGINKNSPQQLFNGFINIGYDKHSMKYTEKGNPSIDKDWLNTNKHNGCKFSELILEARSVGKISNYIENSIIGYQYRGRIHPTFKSTKQDDASGTVTGRFSCSNPNLQQVPKRDAVYAKPVRSLFVPDEGMKWVSADYSQQEPRIALHYAVLKNLPGAKATLQKFLDNPKTDTHQAVADMAKIERDIAKHINNGILYGIGKAKLGRKLNLDVVEATELIDRFNKNFPYPKKLLYDASNVASRRGFVRTFLGRRRRFDMWESSIKDFGDPSNIPLHKKAALKRYGSVKRAHVYKALNAIVQGTAADMMKKAAVDMYKEGYIPSLLVHDETNIMLPDDGNIGGHVSRIRELMENSIKLVVPIIADIDIGDNWGMMDITEGK